VIENQDNGRRPNTFSTNVERYMEEARNTFTSVSGTLGLICAALPPALMFAFASHKALVPLIGPAGALTVAIALASALEATGVKVAHTALDFFATWREGDKEALAGFITATVLTGIYLASGAVAIIKFDNNSTIRLAGLLSYAVAAIMYIGSGLEMMLHSRKAGVLAQLRRQLQGWQVKAEKLQQDLQEVLTKLESVSKTNTENERQVAELEAQVKPLETRLAQLEIQNADLSSANHQLEIEVAALQESERILQAFNPLVQDIGKLLAGDDLTQTEIANRHQTSESTVSRLKGQLNGKLGG
jgi:DNA-directed RNA polymerase specialized sigma subunit